MISNDIQAGLTGGFPSIAVVSYGSLLKILVSCGMKVAKKAPKKHQKSTKKARKKHDKSSLRTAVLAPSTKQHTKGSTP
ncbi:MULTISPECIES: hypothetical protein [unclassified Paenibacillus]|uniref:hypothetical protein n=1 Tax=unclassified Paenibacillus TaxID=185978 RepID=UPI003625E325